jgi:PAS domain-containing protein
MTASAPRAPTREATPAARGLDPAEEPLELILARNLVSIVTLAAFLVDVDGQIAFYNEAAARIVGRSFEETGTLAREEWNARFGPFDEHGAPLRSDQLPLAMALREGRPVFGRFHIRGEAGLLDIEAGALPLVGPAGYHGAIVVFWVPAGRGAP